MSDLGAQSPVDSHGPPSDEPGASISDASDAPESATDDGREQPEPSGPDALAEAVQRLREAQEYLSYRLAVEFDRLRLRLRRAASWAAVGVAALAVLAAVLMTSTGLLLWGVSDLVARALGQPMWVGAVIIGGGVLAVSTLALWLALWSWNWSAFNAVRRKYARRRNRQRRQFDRTIDPRDDHR